MWEARGGAPELKQRNLRGREKSETGEEEGGHALTGGEPERKVSEGCLRWGRDVRRSGGQRISAKTGTQKTKSSRWASTLSPAVLHTRTLLKVSCASETLKYIKIEK